MLLHFCWQALVFWRLCQIDLTTLTWFFCFCNAYAYAYASAYAYAHVYAYVKLFLTN